MKFYEGKSVLVAGGTGTVGMALVSELQHRGADVIVVALDTKEYANAVLPKDTEYISADLTDAEMCLWLTMNMDVVFDMVGIKGSTLTNSGTFSRSLVSYIKFQTALMDACAKNKVPHYLFPGSVNEYPPMTHPKAEDELWNGLPVQNDKYVGLVKRMGEMQAQAYFEEGSWTGAKIIRMSNVYGPGDDFNPKTAQVISALIAKSLENKHVKVHGDGTAVRDFVYVDDAAYWACEAVEKLPPCVPVNIGAGRGIGIREVCETIQEFIDVEFEFMPQSYSGDKMRVLSVDRAKELLGFFARTSLQDGIKQSIEWYKQNKGITALKGKFYERETI